jgi:hypothetical protein
MPSRSAQTPPTQLAAQEAVLLDQIRERVPLAAFQPAGQGQQQHLEGGRVDHEPEVISRQEVFAVHNGSAELWDSTGNHSLGACRDRDCATARGILPSRFSWLDTTCLADTEQLRCDRRVLGRRLRDWRKKSCQ